MKCQKTVNDHGTLPVTLLMMILLQSTDGVHLALQMDGVKFGKNKLRVQRCTQQQADSRKPNNTTPSSMSARNRNVSAKHDNQKSWSGTTGWWFL